jgi:enoyl-CoA hydratase/carnithine racemase
LELGSAKEAPVDATTTPAKATAEGLHLTRQSPACWRVTFDNPPSNVMGPETVRQFQQIIDAIERSEDLKVVVFDSAIDGYFLNHSDFTEAALKWGARD